MATKRNAIARKTVNEGGNVVSFDFSDGRKLLFEMSKVPAEITARLALHGASQKIGDNYAGAESVEDAYTDAAEVIDQLYAGSFMAKRAAGEPRIGLLIEALSRISGKPIDVCREAIITMSDDLKKNLRADARLKQAMLAIQKERADAEVAAADGGIDIGSLF